jgi:hypothetical protein
MSSINAENITVTNLTVTYINGKPVSSGCSSCSGCSCDQTDDCYDCPDENTTCPECLDLPPLPPAGPQGETGASVINTLQQVLDAGNTATGANAIISLTNSGIGYITNPQLVLNNSNATSGSTAGVPSIEYYKSGRLAIANDIIASQNFYADTTGPTKTEFARIEVLSQNIGGAPGLDGTITLRPLVNGVFNTFISLNGSSQRIEIGKEIDLNNNSIVTASGNITISAASSSGTGTITITPKVAGNLIFSNLPTSIVGLPTGAVWNNSGVLNIVP